ncbi:MerR family transcriptional regulator [Undibacterium parvum]|uniref:MerR family transcriptional regulator n=1 Tax=Undibacterium parvum TaxID=401471 RepID=A0A3S9HP49_9BURK|nr:MerR family transcriptional regulator [Undibacterium parvum]AZP13849.1 MerR family transcriptional regulator [Undibacterium parvum]
MLLKIGELASRTGITVRTLHHYDKIGLLHPSARSAAAYRLYNRNDVAQLHRIQALRGLDLSLAEIAELLQGEGTGLQELIDQQVRGLEQQMLQTRELHRRLQSLSELLRSQDQPNLDYWLTTLSLMSSFGKYFSKSDLAILKQRKQSTQGNAELMMEPVIAAVRSLMDQGIASNDTRAVALSVRWHKIMNVAMAEDPRLFVKIEEMTRNELAVQALTGVDGGMLDYLTHATAEQRYQIYRKYLSPAELEHFRRRFFEDARAWIALFAAIRQQMELGNTVETVAVQDLLARWSTLSLRAWGDQASTLAKVRLAHENEAALSLGPGLSPELLAYVQQGLQYRDQISANNKKPDASDQPEQDTHHE